MVSIPNLHDFSGFWIFAIPLGPCWLFYHCFFRQLDLQIHKAYRDTGVECWGITTHRHQTIHRTYFMETSRTYRIRYAYQPPGEEDSIFHMDFVEVSKQQFNMRAFPVLVLPGRPSSGIPKSNVIMESQRCDKTFIAIMNVLSVFWTIFLVFIFATANCTGIDERGRVCHEYQSWCRTCEIDYQTIGISTGIVFVIGLVGSSCVYWGNYSRVTGRVAFKRVALSAPSLPAQNGPIPMANVVALLGDVEREEEDNGCEATVACKSATANFPAVAKAEIIPDGSEQTTPNGHAEVKMIELV